MTDIENSALIDLILNEHGAANPQLKEQMDAVVEECERSGKSAYEVIVNFGLFTKEDLLQAMADNLGSYVWDPKAFGDISRDVIEKVDLTLARTHQVIPIRCDDLGIDLAMRRPLDYQTVEALRFILNKDILPVPCDPDIFDGELERYYPEKVDSVADIVAEFNINPEELEDEGDEEDLANAAPIIKFVDAVIKQAVHDKASDIHFEPFEKNFRIRYRVDGALYEMPPPPRSLAAPVISRIKIISGLNISERRRPQDGRIQMKVNGTSSTPSWTGCWTSPTVLASGS